MIDANLIRYHHHHHHHNYISSPIHYNILHTISSSKSHQRIFFLLINEFQLKIGSNLNPALFFPCIYSLCFLNRFFLFGKFKKLIMIIMNFCFVLSFDNHHDDHRGCCCFILMSFIFSLSFFHFVVLNN